MWCCLSDYFPALLVLVSLFLAWISFQRFPRGNVPSVEYKKGSTLCERILIRCPILQERYKPTLLWGWNGHLQTLIFGAIGRFNLPPIRSQRHSVTTSDGSTVYYDLYEPEGVKDCQYTFLFCPGIGNSCESRYVKSFAPHAMEHGFRVLAFSHVGTLRGEKLTGQRIFTYGGTGDMSAVFEHACAMYPHTKFIGVGLSLGACILLRFLGEDPERRKKFICAVSACQGYDPTIAMPYMHDWTNFRRLYNFGITLKHVELIYRHRDVLLAPKQSTAKLNNHHSKQIKNNYFEESTGNSKPRLKTKPYPNKIQHSSAIKRHYHDYNVDGIALDHSLIEPPSHHKLRRAFSMMDLDECYTRRVCGFKSVDDLYQWTSCVDLLHEIRELPMLIVHAEDDPLIVNHIVLGIPRKYIDNCNPNAMLVMSKRGGHLGFFEGGMLIPNTTSWIDRMIVQFTHACVNELQTSQ